MNKLLHPNLAFRISAGAALAAMVSLHVVACSDDTTSTPGPEAGAGGEQGSGGAGTGGRSSGGTGGGKAGAGGTAGTGGSSTGGATGGGGMDAGAPEAGPAPGGPDGSLDGGSEGGAVPDAAPDGPPAPPPCGAPADSTKAKLCLDFDPDVVKLESGDPQLDGQGTLFIDIFATSDQDAAPIKTIVYPPKTDPDAGFPSVSVYSLPELPIDDLPETFYMRTVFADNPFFETFHSVVLYGAFVGGFDLTVGAFKQPVPMRQVNLTKGQGTRVKQHLTALRKFTTVVKLNAGVTPAPAGDGQGQLSVGAFDVSSPAGAPVLGGAVLGCKDVTQGPIDVTGFVYGTGDRWLGAQLDDFGQGDLSKPGDIVSLGAGPSGQQIRSEQKFTITDQYSVNIPEVLLNVVLPGSTGLTNVSCN